MTPYVWPETPSLGPVVLVSDAHLGGPGGDGSRLREQLLALSTDVCSLVVFMGDLFHVWVGDRRFETAPITGFVPVLEELRRRGVPSVYVEGNRDFFLAHSSYAALFDRVVSELSFVQAGTRYLAVHGDGLNDRDWRYRFWRGLSKSRFARWSVRIVPGAAARWLVDSTEERLSRTNFEHKNVLPEKVIRAYAEKRLQAGYDAVLLGHFHVGRRWPVAGGEVRLLDAWYNEHSIEWLGRE